LAIENLWLAARAEGLGLGWVTLFPPNELAALVGLPEGVETLGWLCLGWPDERPPAPGLERAGWSHRLSLDDVIVEERWGTPGPQRPPSHVRAPDQAAIVAARDESDLLLTPPSSLGALDRCLERLGALGITNPPAATLVIVAADHPVADHGVSTYPTHVTREVLEASLAGESLGAAAAAAVGLELVVVDAGVHGEPLPATLGCRALGRRGDLVRTDALEPSDVTRLIAFGEQLGASAIETPLVAIGEVGIGNTTVAAALAAALLDLDPTSSVGLGAGGDARTLERKRAVVRAAVERARERGVTGRGEPYAALAAVGGPELVVLTGVVLGVAARGGAIVLDGFATTLAGLCAVRIEPGVAAHLLAGQRSREQGHQHVLDELGLEPLLDLRMRSGEGVGAVFATQLLIAGIRTRQITGRVTQA